MVKEHAKKRTFVAVNEAKKHKNLARGYGSGARHSLGKGAGRFNSKGGFEGSYKVSIEALKRRTRCANCHQVGHWHKECPRPNRLSGKSDKDHGAHLLEAGAHEAHFLGFDDFLRIKKAMNADDGNPTTYGGSSSSGSRARPAGTASVLSAYKERLPVHDVCFLDRQPLQTPHEDDSTCATVDTGCQRSAVGSETLRKMLEHQPPGLRTVVKNEVHHFKSINGISKTDHVACVPTSLGPRGCVLRPAVFEDEDTKKAPFLLSLPFLLHCRSVLHLDPMEGLSLELKRFRHKIPLHIGPTGALRVPLHQFTDSIKAELRHALEQLDSEHDVNQLDDLREDRLSRHPSASISPRDPPPPELRRHAVREALSHAEEGGLHRERVGVEPDGSTHDSVVRACHPRDPVVPSRGSRARRTC